MPLELRRRMQRRGVRPLVYLASLNLCVLVVSLVMELFRRPRRGGRSGTNEVACPSRVARGRTDTVAGFPIQQSPQDSGKPTGENEDTQDAAFMAGVEATLGVIGAVGELVREVVKSSPEAIAGTRRRNGRSHDDA